MPTDLAPLVCVVGGLLIEGAISREYLHDSKSTAAPFIIDPGFVKELDLAAGRRMYRTGDLVRQDKDDTLTYLGRRDMQIKVRGQRVEVGEIESRMSQLLPGNPSVCVELVQPSYSSLNWSRLMAAIDMQGAGSSKEAVPGTLCDASGAMRNLFQILHNQLLGEMPPYMISSHFVPFAVWTTLQGSEGP